MSDDQFSGIENDDMRRYLQEQNETQKSAVFDITYRAAVEKGKTPAQATAAAVEAERRNVFGYKYKTDRNGEPIQDGVGAWPHHVTANSLAAIRKYEGKEAWEKIITRLWKEAPEVARKIGAPEAPRAGA